MHNANQFGTVDFTNNIVLNGLNLDDKSKFVFDLSGGYNVLDLIVSRVSSSTETKGLNGLFQKPILGNPARTQQIAAAPTLSAGVLTVTFIDSAWKNFRIQEVLGDGTAAMNQGRVIEVGAGYVKMVPAGNTITTGWSTTLHFQAGQFATFLYVASETRGSSGLDSMFEYPQYISNQTGVIRDNVTLYKADMTQTWVKVMDNGDWYSAQDMFLIESMARQMELRALWSQFNSANGVQYSKGLKECIKDPLRDGTYRSYSNIPTTGQIIEYFNNIADKQNIGKMSLTHLVGRGFLSVLQNITSQYIQYVGKNNTFGGLSVEGLDVYEFAINGVANNFVMAPIFNNRDLFPALSGISGAGAFTRMQYTCVTLDTQMYRAKGGGMLPAMEKVYFGNEIDYYYMPGVGGSNIGGSTVFTTGNPYLAVTDKDAVTFGYYSNCCYDFMTQRMGWSELAY